MSERISWCKCDKEDGDNPNCPLHFEARVDKKRYGELEDRSGIYVRAKGLTDKWETVGIEHLDKPSLLAWLKSRGGDNPWAEDVVGILLGHGHLHEKKPPQE
jgi:hypothetical protein